MNIQQLEYIIALDRYKNFSKAADSCFITQATLSTMVKKLEEEFRVVIFDRKTNPLITTDCGKEIVAQANLIINQINQLKQISLNLKSTITGEIKIGIIPTIAGNIIHRIIPSILIKYSELKITIYEITTNEITAKLKTGEIDAGIVSTPLGLKEIEEEILYYEKLLVYGKNTKKTKFESPKDIISENIWLLEQGNCITDQIINLCSISSKKMQTNFIFNPNTFDSLINIVDQMKGLTLLPELYVLDLPNDKKNNVSDFESPFPVREISFVFYRPFAKLRIIEALSMEIKELILPILQTSTLKNSEMKIAKM